MLLVCHDATFSSCLPRVFLLFTVEPKEEGRVIKQVQTVVTAVSKSMGVAREKNTLKANISTSYCTYTMNSSFSSTDLRKGMC